jgi:hypothetical protein
LVPEVPSAYQAGVLDKAIGQGGLAVIDVGNDAEITGLAHVSPSATPEDRAPSIGGGLVHLSHSGEEVNQGTPQDFTHFFSCPGSPPTILLDSFA